MSSPELPLPLRISSETESVELEDFIPVYPDDEDENIQALLSAKKEMQEMASSLHEEVPVRGEYYVNQKLFIRMMTAYDRVLNISETGVGKSCQIIGLREHLKKSGSHIKNAYILQKPSTIREFRYQILCSCTKGEYETDMVKKATNESVRKSNITREIKKWYHIMKYSEFASMINREAYTDEQIVEIFSDSLFVIDEAHNLRNVGKKDSDKSLGYIYDTIKRVLHLVKRSKIVIATATPLINGVRNFAKIANLALPPNRQLPESWNYEHITLSQLEPFLRNNVFYMRSLDTGAYPKYNGERIKDDNDEIYKYTIEVPDPEKEHLVEVIDPHNIPDSYPQPHVELIQKEVESQITIYGTPLGDIQERVYKSLPETFENVQQEIDDSIDEAEDEGRSNSFYSSSRQVSSFVFPDGSFGGSFPRNGGSVESGIGKYIESREPNEYQMTKEFREWVSDLSSLKRLSGKYCDIVKREISEPGCGYCYTDLVSGSGAIVLGMCIEAQKCQVEFSFDGSPSPLYDKQFTRFNEKTSIFERISTGTGLQSVCASFETKRRVRSNFPKAPRYALITGETPDNVFESILEVVKSPENIDGEYIKLVIVSQVGRDGLNIYNCVRGHLVTAGWHSSGMHQAMSRIFRSVSHDELVKRLARTYPSADPTSNKLNVDIYMHAAVPSPESRCKSVEVDFYRHAEGSSILIHRLMRLLKQIDFGCAINKLRNIRHTDKDGSEVCDYLECDYQCAFELRKDEHGNILPPPKLEIDFSTYDILYSDTVVDACVLEIINVMKNKGFLTFEEIRESWIKEGIFSKEKFVYMAIDKLITNRIVLKDRFGFPCYLQTDGYKIYTQRDFPLTLNFNHSNFKDLSTYANNFTAVKYTGISTISEYQTVTTHRETINKIKAMKSISTEDELIHYNTLLDSLSIKMKVELLENAVIEYSKRSNVPYVETTIKRFASFIDLINEPIKDIETSQQLLTSGKNVAGKQKIANMGKTRPNLGLVGPPPDGTLDKYGAPIEKVFAHSLYSIQYKRSTSYDVISNFKNVGHKIRIYKPSWGERGFRDCNPAESIAYNDILQKRINKIIEPFLDYETFGSIIPPDNEFRIHFKNEEITNPDGTTDIRSLNRGRKCNTRNKDVLIDLLANENILTQRVSEIQIASQTRSQLLAYLNEHCTTHDIAIKLPTYSDAKLVLMCKWFVSNVDRTHMCKVLRDHFASKKRILMV